MGRTLETEGLPALLARSHEAPHWAAVADRCLTCTNCTMVCPTCFCTTVDDVPSLDGDRAERWRRWDSCFTLDFSYLHGGAVRASAAARYRQWLTHKLGSWWTQFGSSGCVGCGRCITWCPVGIDLTAEVAALQSHDAAACAARTAPAEEETWTA
jgi:Fe-S-cluster-containing hydrogenase component 2